MLPRVRAPFVIALCCACSILTACGPPATEGGFDSANSAARMYAIEQAARAGDRTQIRNIIEQLDSDDPGVRYLAITALQRLTGQTCGYRHYDPATLRREAIGRWIAAYDDGSIQPMTASPLSAPPSPAARDTVPEPASAPSTPDAPHA